MRAPAPKRTFPKTRASAPPLSTCGEDASWSGFFSLESWKQKTPSPSRRHAVFVEDGKRVVYRKRGTSFETVEVALGASSLGRIVIEKGLEDGDVVALQNPNLPYRDIVPAVEQSGSETTS